MLHRSSSNIISQQKTLSPKQDRSYLITSEIIRKHASTAANIAFSRAHEQRYVLERNHWSAQASCDAQDRFQVGSKNTEQAIGRQDSVRFTGPNAVLRRKPTKNRKLKLVQRLSPFDSDYTITNGSNDPEDCSPRRLSSVDRSSRLNAITKKLASPDTYEEYFTTEQELSSIPSSYRRIQKSKSMFSPLDTLARKYTNTTQETLQDYCPSFSDSKPAQSQFSQVPLRGCKSARFLRARWHQSESNDSALKLARDRFIHDTTQQLKREKPSFLSRSKSQRLVKAVQSPFRNFSTDSDDPEACSSQIQELKIKELNLREFASKASRSVRGKLKRTFGWSSKCNTIKMPVQQVDAKARHFQVHRGNHRSISDSIALSSQLDQDSLTYKVPNVPSIRRIDSDILLKSRIGTPNGPKIHSGKVNSRASSWDSTPHNTASIEDSLKLKSESDECISVNKGTDIRQRSLSPRQVKKMNHGFTYPLVYQPIKKLNKDSDSAAVSSARVYSALMRRLETKQTKIDIKDSRKKKCNSLSYLNHDCEIKSSKLQHREETDFPNIKYVTPEGSKSKTFLSSRCGVHDPLIARIDLAKLSSKNSCCTTVSHEPENIKRTYQLKENNTDIIDAQDHFGYDEYYEPVECLELRKTSTPNSDILRKNGNFSPLNNSWENTFRGSSEITHQKECFTPSVKISGKKKSTFFSGGTVPISNAASPFRRAMQESTYRSRENWSSFQQDFENQTPKTNYSESVYSRTTSGQINKSNTNSHSPKLEKEDTRRIQSDLSPPCGDALIIEQQIYTPTIPPRSIYRRISSINSNEWKPWISSEVAKLEQGKENLRSIPSSENELSLSMTEPLMSDYARSDIQIKNNDAQAHKGITDNLVQPLCIIEQQRLNARNLRTLSSDLTQKSMTVPIEAQKDLSEQNTSIPLTKISSRLMPIFPMKATQSKPSLKHIASIDSSDSSVSVSNLNFRNSLSENLTQYSKSQQLQNEKLSNRSLENSALDRHSENSDGKFSASPTIKSDLDKTKMSKFGNACTKPRFRGSGHRLFGVDAEIFSQVYEPDWTRRTNSGRLSEQLDLKKVGSKKMVEMFLNSRRKRMISSCGDNAATDVDDGSVFL